MAGDGHPSLTLSRAALEEAEAGADNIAAQDDVDVGARLEARLIDPSSDADDQSRNDSRASVYATKRLYDFGHTDALEAAAKTGIEGSRLRFASDQTRYRIQIMKAFFDVLLADLEYARDNEAMAVAYVQADRVRDRFELGQVPESELLREQDAYQALRMKRVRSEARLRATRARLAQLDLRPFESAQRDAEAQVCKHRLNRYEAERELQRTRELYARTVISLHDLQAQEIAFAGADADYTSAVARLEAARLHLEHATVRAPFPGRVLEVSTAPGETVVNAQQATALATPVRDRPMGVRAFVPADAAGVLAPGQTAGVRINGETYPATVERVGMEPDADGRYELALSFDPGDAVLRAGLPASIDTAR